MSRFLSAAAAQGNTFPTNASSAASLCLLGHSTLRRDAERAQLPLDKLFWRWLSGVRTPSSATHVGKATDHNLFYESLVSSRAKIKSLFRNKGSARRATQRRNARRMLRQTHIARKCVCSSPDFGSKSGPTSARHVNVREELNINYSETLNSETLCLNETLQISAILSFSPSLAVPAGPEVCSRS